VICLSIVHYGVIFSNRSPFHEQLHKDAVAEKRLDCGTIFADALMGVFHWRGAGRGNGDSGP
jgi:hypothetical protein